MPVTAEIETQPSGASEESDGRLNGIRDVPDVGLRPKIETDT